VLKNIGVGAGKFLGLRRIFAQIPQISPKNTPKKMTSKKMAAFLFTLAAFFQITALQAPFLPKFSTNLPKFPLTYPKSTK